MKMVKVYNANGDEILACHVDLEYYASIGWKPHQEKPKTKAKVEDSEESE